MHPLKIALQRRGVQARKKLMALLYYLRAQDLKRGRGGKPPPHEVLEPPSNHTEVPEGTSDIYDAITTGYSDDPWFQDEKHTANYTLQDGFWYTKAEQLIVPNMPSIKLSIMEEMHASPMYGHAGTTKTKKQV